MLLFLARTTFASRTAHFFIFLFHFSLSLFAPQFTCNIKLQRKSRIWYHIFHTPCFSMINLCLSTDKKFAVKKNSRKRTRIFKNQRTRTIFIFHLALCFQNQDQISCIPVVQGQFLSKSRNNRKEYLFEIPFFTFSRRRLALKA